MATNDDFAVVFEQLKGILEKFAARCLVAKDTAKTYYLDMPVVGRNKKPVMFAAACVMKNYVSFHLMPVYGFPALLDEVSPELRARMQGKACFNFKTPDPALFKELAKLTKAGFEGFQRWLENEGRRMRDEG